MSLEEYIQEMENRSAIVQTPGTDEDLWSQLQQKENDLVLAAELGKALLEKNEELKRQHEAVVRDFTKKLEMVEQDRHLLRRRLTSTESECEARLLELQNDLSEVSKRLDSKEQTLRQWEKDKSSLVAELNAQNARLTARLKESGAVEVQLRHEVQRLKEQNAAGKTNLQEHMNSVDGLRDELELMMEKRSESEKRLHAIVSERDGLIATLEEASDRILILEKHARERDVKYQHSMKELALTVEGQLLGAVDRTNDGDSGDPRSLLSEMDVSEPTLTEECMSVYRQLRSLCQQLKSHNDDDEDSGLHSDCSNVSLDSQTRQFSAGLLTEIAQELVGLVLDTDVVRLLERLEHARREIQERDAELSRRNEVVMELTSKISLLDVELRQVVEERDQARGDVSDSSMARDEAVAKALHVRDGAVARRNKSEIELAKTRVDLMQANSQLLEIVRQKVELSQQLEQWQMDMQELLDEQLKIKLTRQEDIKKATAEDGLAPVVPPPTRRRILRFFQR